MIRSRPLFFIAALLCAQAFAHAQSMQDPTRPPAAPSHDATGPGTSSGPQLQSVLIARQPGGRHIAVIDGDTVRLGEEYRGARVARITQTEVELVRGKERQVLRMPGADEASPAVTPVPRLQ